MKSVRIDEEVDYPAFDAASPAECSFLVRHVVDSGYFDARGDDLLALSVKGWDQIEPPSGMGGVPGRCFVAMSFAEELDEAYLLGIKPAVEQDCGLIALRMNEGTRT